MNGEAAIRGSSGRATRRAARSGQLYLWRGEPGSLSQDPGRPGCPPEGECRVRPERGRRAGPYLGLLHPLRDGDLPRRRTGGGPQARPALSAGERHLDRSAGRRDGPVRGSAWARSFWPTHCSGRSRAPARLDPRWSSSMRSTSRRPDSMRRMGSCDYPTRCGLCCRCASRAGGLNDEFRIRLAIGAGERPGKQNGPRFGLRGSTMASKRSLRGGARRFPSRPVAQAENRGFGMPPMPKAADSPLLFAFCCFPPASPAFALGAGKQKTAPKDRSNRLIFLKKSGAGEGIRTLDPNLGKVVLYP